MKDGKNEGWWCDTSNPMLTQLTHGAICCRRFAAGFLVDSHSRSIESGYILQKRNSKTRVWLPPKIRSLKLVHSLCLLVNPLASNNDFP